MNNFRVYHGQIAGLFLLLFVFLFSSSSVKGDNVAEPSNLFKDIFEIMSTDTDSAVQMSEEILLRPNIQDSVKAKANYCLGVAYYYKGWYHLSASYYEKSLNSNFCKTNDAFRSKCYNNIGVVYEMADEYERALENYLASMKIDLSLGDLEGVALVKTNIGLLYYYLKQFDKSRKYSEEAKDYFEKEDNSEGLGLVLHNLAILEEELENYSKAYEKLKESLTLHKKNGSTYECANILNNLALVSLEMKDFDSAMKYCNESSGLAEQNNFIYLFNRAKITKAQIFLRQGDIKEAEVVLSKVDTSNLRTEESRRFLKIEIAARKKSIDEFNEELQDYVALKDSVFNEKMAAAVKQFEVKYKTEEKISKIEDQAKLLKQKQKNLKIAVVVITILTGLLVLVFFYKTRLHHSYHALYLKEKQQKDNLFKINNIKSVEKKESFSGMEVNSAYNELWEKILIQMNKRELYLNSAFTLQDLVKAVNSNNKYISETIKIYTKSNFNQFVNFYRVEKAKDLMNKYPLYSTQSIAEMSGFNSLSSFFRVFKEQTGLSPGKYHEINKL
ncbi:AraC family transcriptional regulator [Maribellus maritimus]|uniref:AraC family transcriptional regulator n=1 Tax=Maribellus maritimus TaxID=2870838 RepID=UPI001EEB0AB6|nr:AraC family transcriptional regulator [Maribellus maritimus]MCG6191089.1 AraC family transcriptional regulator [Maribellus maritimus]